MPRIARLAFLLLLGGLGYVVFVLQPSNQREWEYGVEVLPEITIDGDRVQVRKLRDFRSAADGPRSSDFVDRTFDVTRIERVWLVEEPFTIPPFTGFEGVAHTYFVFDFTDEQPLAISVEARRERGESYDVVRGALNQYELMYIWGTEQDLTGRRAVLEKNLLYMWPLQIPYEAARALLLRLATVSQQLETEPRFYNSFVSNCTNELAKAANVVQPDAIPANIALLLPGYSENVLYDLGFIANDRPLDELRETYFISDLVVAELEHEDFSSRLRAELKERESMHSRVDRQL
jgi:hypothetical protein